MIKKIYDKCVAWAGHRYAKPLLALDLLLKVHFPNTTRCNDNSNGSCKKNEFLRIAIIATIFFCIRRLFGYLIGYVFFNEIGVKIFELYGYEDPNFLKDKFSTKGGFSWLGILVTAGFTPLPFKLLTISVALFILI